MAKLYCLLVFYSWKIRNNVVHDGQELGSCFIASTAVSLASILTKLNPFSGHWGAFQRQLSTSSWHPPPSGWIKVNVDATIRLSNVVRVGGVIRDHKGRFLCSFGYNCVHWDSGYMELVAFRSIKRVIKDWMVGAKGIIMEGDNANVIKYLQDSIFKVVHYEVDGMMEDFSFLMGFDSFIFSHRLQQGGEALTKKSFFLFHPYTVMAENPSSFLRQRTATLPFSPLLGDGREPSSFLRQRTATLPFSPLLGDGREPSSFLRQRTATLPFSPLLGDGREPSSFLRQRTATLPFSPLLGDGREPSSFLRQRTATLPFSPLLACSQVDQNVDQNESLTVQTSELSPEKHPDPEQVQRLQQGGEALTKKSFFLFHPYTVMAENPSSFLRQRTATLPFSPLLGDGREPSSFLRQRTATLPFSPLLGDGREPSSFLRQRTATLPFSPLLGDGREPSSFLRQRTATLPFSPLLGDGREPSSFLRQRTATLPFSPLLGEGREPWQALTGKKTALVSKDQVLCLLQEEEKGARKSGHMKNNCPNLKIPPAEEKDKNKPIVKISNDKKQKISWADLASDSSDQELDNESRNKLVHNGSDDSSLVIAIKAINITSFSAYGISWNLGNLGTNQSHRLLNSSWYPPPPEWIKLNVDASLLPSYKAGIGGVLRDLKGRFLLAFGKSFIHWDVGYLELSAIQYSKEILKDWMFKYKGIVIEGDNSNIIKLIQKNNVASTSDVDDSFSFREFDHIIFNCIDRKCNKLADLCANYALSSSFLWEDV
ncbi:hypothetical protein M5K25_003776 [Dendrobium thyrsiflorum]|uniref:RNase H type-1 domain-containing protein n=1 Tax=Dendrobium thyrsiflorum TaxID=117978 RepID=A0ABD0VK41_DENTH